MGELDGGQGEPGLAASATVHTVTGPVPIAELGYVQMHEHLLSDIRGYLDNAPDAVDQPVELANYFRSRVDRDNRDDFLLDDPELAAAELELFAARGGRTIVDVTPVGAGRDPVGLRRIAEHSGVHVLMGTGFYVAPTHPPQVRGATRDSIAESMTAELVEGVDGTGIRAAVIGEIGLSWPAHRDEVKVLEAAAMAQAATGAPLMIHPGRHQDAPLHHLDVVRAAGGEPGRVVMCHIDRTLFDVESMAALAAAGCVLEFDLFGTESSYYPQDWSVDLPNDGTRVRYLAELVGLGFASQLLIAEDVCRKTQLIRYGGEGYAHILDRVLGLMGRRGITAADIEQITRHTPARLLDRTAAARL